MADIDLFDDNLIPPSSLKRFLAASRWSIIEDRPSEWEVWRSPADLSPLSVTLVFDEEYEDYERRLEEAIDGITHLYKFSISELMERITALSADLFFFRIQQESIDGTIPFRQAQRALDSIATMVRAAATTVASPSHSHKGKRPAEVEQFLAEDLRLGHTKRGSFVVTAAARLDSAESRQVESGQTDGKDAAVSDEARKPEMDDGTTTSEEDIVIPPFARRVMTTFSRGLQSAKAVGNDTEAVGLAVEQGLSLELAEALERISNEEGLQTIEVSFDWSESVPPPEDLVPVVVFDRSALDSLPRVTEQLQIRVPPRQVEVVGQVVALSRNLADEEAAESGEVTILGDVDGRVRRVLLDLDGEAHRYAIQAYSGKFPVIVRGELVKRRSWRLEGFVSMDLEAARLMATRHSTQAVSASPQLAELEFGATEVVDQAADEAEAAGDDGATESD